MSFLSVLKSIGHVFGAVATAATPLEPLIGAIPVAGPIADTVLSAITAAEGLVTTASQGAAKKAVVTAVVNAQHPGVDQSALSTTIDQVVAAMNALSTALASIPAPAPAAKG
jgi:hypothetical protein